MSWENKLKDVCDHLYNREWFWLGSGDANRFKYIHIKVDTRDNHCVLSDRDGISFELNDLLNLKKTVLPSLLKEISSNNIQEETNSMINEIKNLKEEIRKLKKHIDLHCINTDY